MRTVRIEGLYKRVSLQDYASKAIKSVTAELSVVRRFKPRNTVSSVREGYVSRALALREVL